MCAPSNNLVSDALAEQIMRDATEALSRPDSFSPAARYFADAVYALARDRQARIELAATPGGGDE
jgi:hypothetical protein